MDPVPTLPYPQHSIACLAHYSHKRNVWSLDALEISNDLGWCSLQLKIQIQNCCPEILDKKICTSVARVTWTWSKIDNLWFDRWKLQMFKSDDLNISSFGFEIAWCRPVWNLRKIKFWHLNCSSKLDISRCDLWTSQIMKVDNFNHSTPGFKIAWCRRVWKSPRKRAGNLGDVKSIKLGYFEIGYPAYQKCWYVIISMIQNLDSELLDFDMSENLEEKGSRNLVIWISSDRDISRFDLCQLQMFKENNFNNSNSWMHTHCLFRDFHVSQNQTHLNPELDVLRTSTFHICNWILPSSDAMSLFDPVHIAG